MILFVMQQKFISKQYKRKLKIPDKVSENYANCIESSKSDNLHEQF